MAVLTNVQLAISNLRGMPKAPAVFLLRHVPSKRVYVSHTTNLRTRLHWWYNRLSNIRGSGSVPRAMQALLDQTGADPSHWTFAVLDQGPFPAGTETIEQRHERALHKLHALYPQLLLQQPRPAGVKRVPTYNPNGRSRGVSPRAWLKGRLGLGDPMPEQMPEHGWAIDPYTLEPAAHFNTPFGEYLYRSMTKTPVPGRTSGVFNPSVEAIKGLFDIWQRGNYHDVAVSDADAPITVEQALLLPVPELVDDLPIVPAPVTKVEHVPASRADISINVPAPAAAPAPEPIAPVRRRGRDPRKVQAALEARRRVGGIALDENGEEYFVSPEASPDAKPVDGDTEDNSLLDRLGI